MGYEVPFTIADVADLLGIYRLKGGTENAFGVECPFCGDTRGKCNFCVIKDGELKNVYHCYHCGAGGNMLTLYADLTGIYGPKRYQQAYWQVREQLDCGSKKFRIQRQNRIECIKHIDKKKEEIVLEEDYLDEVYREMLSILKLKECHKADFRRRGLSELDISFMEERGYRSTESSDSMRIARLLLLRGFSLQGVPGFFRNHNGDWQAAFYSANEGYLCPVLSVKQKIIGFQIRLDKPYKKRKYVWFTSCGLDGGASSKSPASLSGTMKGNSIYVTEGILKAEIAYQKSGQAYVGTPGVSNYKGLYQILLELKEQGLQMVYECYDMDKMMSLECMWDYDASCRQCEGKQQGSECPKKRRKRDAIRKGCLKLYEICDELDLTCKRMEWDVGEDGQWNGIYKGIDDWINKK